MSAPWKQLLQYHAEPEDPEWDEEGKTPYLLDEEGRKIRSSAGYAKLDFRDEDIKSTIEKHLKKFTLPPNFAITRELEEDLDIVLQKRRELIENRHDAVYVEDRTLHTELWNLVIATLLAIVANPKDWPHELDVLREWPEAVKDIWRLVRKNRFEQKRWSIGWPAAKTVTGEDGAAISQYHNKAADTDDSKDDEIVDLSLEETPYGLLDGPNSVKKWFKNEAPDIEELKKMVGQISDPYGRQAVSYVLRRIPKNHRLNPDTFTFIVKAFHDISAAIDNLEDILFKNDTLSADQRKAARKRIVEIHAFLAALHGIFGFTTIPDLMPSTEVEVWESSTGSASKGEHTSNTDVPIVGDRWRSHHSNGPNGKAPIVQEKESPQLNDPERYPPVGQSPLQSPARQPNSRVIAPSRRAAITASQVPPGNRHANRSSSPQFPSLHSRSTIQHAKSSAKAKATSTKRKRGSADEGQPSTKRGNHQPNRPKTVVNLPQQ
ncbi:hypothetical protein FRC02_005975, partial [Tulasnella sp. 418]